MSAIANGKPPTPYGSGQTSPPRCSSSPMSRWSARKAVPLCLMLALAEILARSGERVGCPGVMEPVSSRNAAERLALALSHAAPQTALPDLGRVGRMSDVRAESAISSTPTRRWSAASGLRRGAASARPRHRDFPIRRKRISPTPAALSSVIRKPARSWSPDALKPLPPITAAPGSPAARCWRRACGAWAGVFSPTAPTGRRLLRSPQHMETCRGFRPPSGRWRHDRGFPPGPSARRRSCSGCWRCR